MATMETTGRPISGAVPVAADTAGTGWAEGAVCANAAAATANAVMPTVKRTNLID